MEKPEHKLFIKLGKTIEHSERIRKFALTLLEQCKDEKLTVSDVERVCEVILEQAKLVTLHEGLTL